MFRMLKCSLILVSLAGIAAPSADASIVLLDSRATYLQVDPAGCCGFPEGDFPNAAPLELAAFGVEPGDDLSLRQVGDFAFGFETPDNVAEGIVALFSATNEILDNAFPGPVQRVPGAVASGLAAFETSLSDVPFDFFVPSMEAVILTVPEDAAYLFFTLNDVYFTDNDDPDGDFGIEVLAPARAVPEPGPLLLISGALVAGGFGRRLRSSPRARS